MVNSEWGMEKIVLVSMFKVQGLKNRWIVNGEKDK